MSDLVKGKWYWIDSPGCPLDGVVGVVVWHKHGIASMIITLEHPREGPFEIGVDVLYEHVRLVDPQPSVALGRPGRGLADGDPCRERAAAGLQDNANASRLIARDLRRALGESWETARKAPDGSWAPTPGGILRDCYLAISPSNGEVVARFRRETWMIVGRWSYAAR
jgi:hypothetical protein